MMVRDLKKWCDKQKDTDVVRFLCWDDYAEAYTREDTVHLDTRKPKPDEFEHKECECFELVDFKGEKRRYCNFRDVFLTGAYGLDEYNSCSDFKHKNLEIEFYDD